MPALPLPSGNAVAMMSLKTHFSKEVQINLQMGEPVQDPQSLQSRLASVETAYQIQRAVLTAASHFQNALMLATDSGGSHSPQDQLSQQQLGEEMLRLIDILQQ